MLPGEPAGQLFEFSLRCLIGLEIEDALQKVDQRIEGAALIIGRTAVLDHGRPAVRGYALGQCLDEAGLADAGFAADQHDLPVPFLNLFPAFPQEAEFLFATGQRGEPGLQRRLERAARPAVRDDPVRPDRLGHAAQAPGAQVFRHEQPAHELVCVGADEQGAGRGRGLEPRRDVRHRPGDVHRVAADLAGHDQPGMRAEAHFQRMFEPCRELLDLLDDVEPGMECARRVVLVRHGIAEERQHAVAQILCDMAGVVVDDARAALVIGAQHVPPLFGIQPFGQLRRSHQIAEHDRDLAPVRRDLRRPLAGTRLLGSRLIRRSDERGVIRRGGGGLRDCCCGSGVGCLGRCSLWDCGGRGRAQGLSARTAELGARRVLEITARAAPGERGAALGAERHASLIREAAARTRHTDRLAGWYNRGRRNCQVDGRAFPSNREEGFLWKLHTRVSLARCDILRQA